MSELAADVLVIGAGAAGIAAARAAHESGARVALATLAPGATSFTSAVVWGAAREPFASWSQGGGFRAGGRYVTVAGWIVGSAQGALASLLDLSALGQAPVGVVDLATHPSWSARLVASTLGGRVIPCPDGPVEETFRETASRLDTEGIADGVAASIRASCEGLAGVLFPPVLGLRRDDVAARMSRALGLPVGEAAGGPGDPPGVRLDRALRRWIPDGVAVVRARAAVTIGPEASVALSDGRAVRAKSVVLATGGLTGGGLVFDRALRDATAGAPLWTRARHPVSDLPGASRGADPAAWFDDQESAASGAGVRVNARGVVVDTDGESVLAPWLFAAGDVTSSLEGYGLADALAAGARAGAEAARHARGR